MIATAPLHQVQASTFHVGLGFSGDSDTTHGLVEATEMARDGLRGATPQIALVLTVGAPGSDPVRAVRAVLGPVGVAGGATTCLMTGAGLTERGSLVIAIATEGDATTGAVAIRGPNLGAAGQNAARIVMAGWPFRIRYPRGLGMAFVEAGAPREFLEAWREFMGPKMRTVCAAMPGPLYGSSSSPPTASVACLEASYATGLGYADGLGGTRALLDGAVEATTTALKRLNERPARLVLVLESVSRRHALGPAAADEWRQIQETVGEHVPCVGWLCDRVDGYGRGLQPADQPGALIVAAMGDGPGCHSGT